MSIYIKRIEEFEARQYLPNEPGFDVQEIIDWIMSFENKSSTYPTSVVQNTDGTLTITYYNVADGERYDTVEDGMFLFTRTVPDTGFQSIVSLADDAFNAYYQLK